ncbi:sialate O-acetylesterase [Verrucomicrobiota bacterium]
MRNRLVNWVCLLVFVFTGMNAVSADFELGSPFLDHMVLQRDRDIIVWGWGEAGQEVMVSLDKKTVKASIGKDGRWRVSLPAMKAGGPFEFKAVSGDSKFVYKDVLLGDVWLAFGQSNMAMGLRNKEEAAKLNDPVARNRIREFKVANSYFVEPQERLPIPSQWTTCEKGVGNWSGVAWGTIYRLYEKLEVPMAVIRVPHGGSAIYPWLPHDVVEESDKFRKYYECEETYKKGYLDNVAAGHVDPLAYDKYKKSLKDKARNKQSGAVQQLSSLLYNSKIHPVVPYQLRGLLYYQGESSRGAPEGYGELLKLMVKSYRKAWGNDELYMAVIQLPSSGTKIDTMDPNKLCWAWIRNEQKAVLDLPNAGLVVTYDDDKTENQVSLHPPDKSLLCERLANLLLHDVYGQKDIEVYGPAYKSHKIDGSIITIEFSFSEGLTTDDGDDPKSFRIAGADRQWHFATSAKIKGEKVIISSDAVKEPVAVRYAWDDHPDVNLYNKAGLPAVSFRTDDWERIDDRKRLPWQGAVFPGQL